MRIATALAGCALIAVAVAPARAQSMGKSAMKPSAMVDTQHMAHSDSAAKQPTALPPHVNGMKKADVEEYVRSKKQMGKSSMSSPMHDAEKPKAPARRSVKDTAMSKTKTQRMSGDSSSMMKKAPK